MSEYADGFDDGKGEKFDELMVEIVNLRLDFQNCEAKRVGAINSLREHINICNWLKIENAALRGLLERSKPAVRWCMGNEYDPTAKGAAAILLRDIDALLKEKGK